MSPRAVCFRREVFTCAPSARLALLVCIGDVIREQFQLGSADLGGSEGRHFHETVAHDRAHVCRNEILALLEYRAIGTARPPELLCSGMTEPRRMTLGTVTIEELFSRQNVGCH